jgi:tRNA(Arg) A34 adenosine deaminase TadA
MQWILLVVGFLTVTALAENVSTSPGKAVDPSLASGLAKIVPLPDDPACDANDRRFIKRTYELARSAADHGNRPFGALLVKDGKIIFENENSVRTSHDVTQHAETGLISKASRKLDPATLAACTLYTSTEPCVMCCGSIHWAGIRRVVYGTTALQVDHMIAIILSNPQAVSAHPLQIREIYARTAPEMTVKGPLMEAEGLQIHEAFWPADLLKK